MDSNDQKEIFVTQTQNRTVENFIPNVNVPVHQHNGVDSLKLNPALTRLPVASVTTASTAPTDAAEEGSVRVFYDGTNYYLWTRANKTWTGHQLNSATMSHVFAYRTAAQSVSTGTTVVFDNEGYDTLSEYDTSNGIFTAINAGYYLVNAIVTSAYIAYTAGNYWGNRILVNGSPVSLVITNCQTTSSQVFGAMVSKTVYLTAGQTIAIDVVHDLGGSQNTRNDATRVYLTIDRLS